jgi:hypothetical protein
MLTQLAVGKNGSVLQVPFLNLPQNIQNRAGRVNVRIGGSSIDTTSLVNHLGTANTSAIIVLTGTPDPVRHFLAFFSRLLTSILDPDPFYDRIPLHAR